MQAISRQSLVTKPFCHSRGVITAKAFGSTLSEQRYRFVYSFAAAMTRLSAHHWAGTAQLPSIVSMNVIERLLLAGQVARVGCENGEGIVSVRTQRAVTRTDSS